MQLATLIATLAAVQGTGPISQNALVDGDKVFLFLPPVLVAEGRWISSAWSDDSQYLLLVTESSTIPPADYKSWFESGKQSSAGAEVRVSTYSVRTGRAKELWSSATRPRMKAGCTFFRGSDVAIVTITRPDKTSTVLRVTPSTSKAEVVETVSGETDLTVYQDKLAAVSLDDPPSVRFIPIRGNVYARQPLSSAGGVSFTKDGVPFLSGVHAPGKHLTIKPGGSESWVDGLPELGPGFDEAFETSNIMAHESKLSVPGGPELTHLSARLRKGSGIVFIATDAVANWPENDVGVLYTVGDSLNLVRPIVQISKEAYQKRLDAELRAEIMKRLVDIGRALQTYARSHKNAYPNKEQLESGALDPYTADPVSGKRQSNLLSGFVYHGTTMRSSAPATTEAGFIVCPDGRAVLYQDGHVAFVPNRN